VRFEIPAKNFERARHFYYQVFGWDIKQIFLGKNEYLNARSVGVNERGLPNEPGAINGAIIKKQGCHIPDRYCQCYFPWRGIKKNEPLSTESRTYLY